MKEFDAVAFDIDGTLYPNYRFYLRVAPLSLPRLPLLAAFRKTRQIMRSVPGDEDFRDAQARIAAGLLKKDEALVKREIDEFIYKLWQPHFKGLKTYPHVRQTIENLRRNGYKTAALSDFPIGDKLVGMRLDGLWDVELSSESVGQMKPARKPFLRLADELRCLPERVLFVGNSVACDIRGAKGAGMKAALIRRGISFLGGGGADFVFRDYRQLERFVLG
ncbi:MAG: HAD family hydrolase [Spirochaetaceae bacterium]|jgi:putative hydrolase of the HAD superfamily|nr:HAD family hydrolase [Spirochaetaceae bacterium]